MCICIVNICVVLIDRKIISGKVICMNEITNNIFNVPAKLKPVETATILGKEFVIYGTIQNPWFKAKDVAEWIEYDASSINKLISSVDEDEKVRKTIPTLGGNQEVWFLSENGVYEVLMQSRKPIAKDFKKEVKKLLKAIRTKQIIAQPIDGKVALELALAEAIKSNQIVAEKYAVEHEKTEKQRLRTEQTKSITEREITLSNDKVTILREKVEFIRQQNIKKALKIKQFTDPLKQEIKSMTNELAQQVVQAEYTKKLKQLDADGKYMLYIFHNPTNPTIYKIGKSNSLGNRLAIGTSENPNLQILYKRYCSCQMACDELEDTIHQELKEYNYKLYSETGSKEWFVLTKEKLNEIVNKYQFVEVN